MSSRYMWTRAQPGGVQQNLRRDRLLQYPIRIPAPALSPQLPNRGPALTPAARRLTMLQGGLALHRARYCQDYGGLCFGPLAGPALDAAANSGLDRHDGPLLPPRLLCGGRCQNLRRQAPLPVVQSHPERPRRGTETRTTPAQPHSEAGLCGGMPGCSIPIRFRTPTDPFPRLARPRPPRSPSEAAPTAPSRACLRNHLALWQRSLSGTLANKTWV